MRCRLKKEGIPMNYVCNGSFQDFVCLDFETTGLSGTKDKVTEIGAVKVQGGDVVQRFSTLVNPGRPIPPRVVALTGISISLVGEGVSRRLQKSV